MTAVLHEGRFRPSFIDRSKHKDQMYRRTLQVFREKEEAEEWAQRLRKERTRKGYSRSTRLVEKFVNVHGFQVSLWFVTHRIRYVG